MSKEGRPKLSDLLANETGRTAEVDWGNVAAFPKDRVRRVPVNLPFARVPTCAHDPGSGDAFECPHGCNRGTT